MAPARGNLHFYSIVLLGGRWGRPSINAPIHPRKLATIRNIRDARQRRKAIKDIATRQKPRGRSHQGRTPFFRSR